MLWEGFKLIEEFLYKAIMNSPLWAVFLYGLALIIIGYYSMYLFPRGIK